jgi:Holliday junction resolvase
MTNSQTKGKSFERTIANLLSKTTGCRWHRVPCSGATATTRQLKSTQFKGDVFTEEERFRELIIECKAAKELTINDLLNIKSDFKGWIRKLEFTGKDWVLIVKPNNAGIYAFAANPVILSSLFGEKHISLTITNVYSMMKVK